MFKLLISLFCLSQIASGHPQNAAAPSPLPFPDLQALFANLQVQTQEAISNVNTRFLEVSGVKSNEQFITSVAETSQKFATQLRGLSEAFTKQAQDALEKNNVQEAVQNVATRLSESVKQLTQSNPQTQQIAETLQTSLKTALDQANTLLPKLQEQGVEIQTGVRNSLEQLYGSTLETAKKVAAEVDTALKKKE